MKKKLAALSIHAMTAATGNAQLRPVKQHFVVPASVVARAITTTFADRGLRVDAEQVALPVSVFATEPSPVLEVGAVQPLGGLDAAHPEQASARVRLRCKATTTCLPFYAVVTWQDSQDVLASSPAAATKVASIADSPAPNAVKSGSHATLLMEADHARIQMDVISLGSAALGSQVRVASMDRKHTYTGEVIGTNLVKGRF